MRYIAGFQEKVQGSKCKVLSDSKEGFQGKVPSKQSSRFQSPKASRFTFARVLQKGSTLKRFQVPQGFQIQVPKKGMKVFRI